MNAKSHIGRAIRKNLPRGVTERFQALGAIGRAMRMARASVIPFHSGLGESANLLYALARSMKPQVCVEIGSARGKSACYVGMALKENGSGRLYAIDPHMPTDWNDDASVDTLEIMKRNLASLGLAGIVEVVRNRSEQAAEGWTRPIDILFIDGDHSYDGVRRDWELFAPHVSPFGVVVFHDTIWDRKPDPRWAREDMGVPRFVEELRRSGYQVVTLDRDCGVSIVQPVIGGVSLGVQAELGASV